MPQFGSNPSVAAQNLSATQDPNGNPIISSENGFGASPLGVAARTQALYGIPNAHFDLTCADPNSAVEVNNAIPYWNLEYSGQIATTMVYDAATQNWSVRMDPTGAASGDYAILKARTYLLNDSDLALRQKAYAGLTKVGTTGTAQWSIVLSATYYDIAGTQLSTYNIGTAADTGTWTGISGVTTSGSAAISTSAAYADIALTLTAAGSVSGTAKVDINSVLVATSQAAAGGSFLITQTFTSSGTWTRPTGVDYVTVVAIGGGQGGDGGGALMNNTGGATAGGGPGGDSAQWAILKDIYVGGTASVSVGIGAGGTGGTAASATKAIGVATSPLGNAGGGDGGNGGATTFGPYLSVGGGGAPTVTATYYGLATAAAAAGGAGGVVGAGSVGGTHAISAFTNGAPFTPAFTTGGSAGASGTGSSSGGGTSAAGGVANTSAGIAGGGGGGGGAQSTTTSTAGAGGVGGAGAGSGGGAAVRNRNSGGAVVATGGAGASAPTANYGGGGGGGGGAAYTNSSAANYTAQSITLTGGVGGAGQSGFLVVAWVG